MEKKLKAIDFRFFIGCPCIIVGNAYRSTIDVIDAALNRVVVKGGVDYEPFRIKPILRRFESLSRFEVEQLNKLWPHESIKRTTFGSIQLDAEIINYLTLLHVDVFGWIDQGLAEDAEYNTTGAYENMDYKTNDIVKIAGTEYTLGEKVLLDASNLAIGESYIEHTQVNPDRFSIFKKDFDTETIENSWKIIINE